MRTRIPRRSRRAAAAVELAILLPLLAFLFVIGVDFARVYKHTLTLMNCARSGALYGSNSPTRAADTATIKEIALADAGDLNPKPTVEVRLFDLEDGTSHIEVTGSAVAYRDIPVQADAELATDAWLDRIRARRDEGDPEGARASLDLFRERHPHHRLPADLRTLADPAPTR